MAVLLESVVVNDLKVQNAFYCKLSNGQSLDVMSLIKSG